MGNCIIAACVTGDRAALRGDTGANGDSRGTVSNWTGYSVGTNSSEHEKGKESVCFFSPFQPHTGFLLDDR